MTLPSMMELLKLGGIATAFLLLASVVVWVLILERVWFFYKIQKGIKAFHLEVLGLILQGNKDTLRSLCNRHTAVPTAQLLGVALERLSAHDQLMKSRWQEAVERKRQMINQDLRRFLWVLGTIGSAAPFVGLFGTVVGILRTFRDLARSGTGGFAVVAAGIAEALVATAVGIIVAVIAVMAYNAFQTRWAALVLMIKLQIQELCEILEGHQRSDTPVSNQQVI